MVTPSEPTRIIDALVKQAQQSIQGARLPTHTRYVRYEQFKKQLQWLNLTPAAYEDAVKRIAKELRL